MTYWCCILMLTGLNQCATHAYPISGLHDLTIQELLHVPIHVLHMLEPTTSGFVHPSPNHSIHTHLCPFWYTCPFWIYVLPILCLYGFEMSIWNPKHIQMKKLSTTKFYNFSRSTTLVLAISPSEVVWRIWILNLRKLKHNFPLIDYLKWKKNHQLQISCTTFLDLQLCFARSPSRSFEKFKFQMWEIQTKFCCIDFK
jgi:hypothetical protein